MIGGTWASGITITALFVGYRRDEEVALGSQSFFQRVCTLISEPVRAQLSTPLMSLFTMVVVPLFLALVTSVRTILRLQKIVRPGHLTEAQFVSSRKAKLKATFMITAVVVAFAVCWAPISVFFSWEMFNFPQRNACDYNYVLYSILIMMLLGSFVVNPIIYCYFNQDFRNGIISMGRAVQIVSINVLIWVKCRGQM
jgi:hypothetical protein